MRRDLCCFLLPHFPGGTGLLKGFSVQCLRCPAAIPLPQDCLPRGPALCTHRPACLTVCGHKENEVIYFLSSELHFTLFFPLKIIDQRARTGKYPCAGTTNSRSICMGKPILKNFGVVRMWLLVPTLERCTRRHLLQKKKFKSCFCFSPLLFLLPCRSCLVGAALQPLIHTVCSFSASRSGCKWFLQGHAMMQEQSKETTENSWYVFHDLARYKSPYFLGKGKRGSKFLFVHREKERYCTRRAVEQCGNEQQD